MPNRFIAVQSLAVMAVYLFNMRVLPVEHDKASAMAKTLGRFVVPALMVLGQTFLTPLIPGEAGKLFGVLLLTLRLAAGGGVMPIELTGD